MAKQILLCLTDLYSLATAALKLAQGALDWLLFRCVSACAACSRRHRAELLALVKARIS